MRRLTHTLEGMLQINTNFKRTETIRIGFILAFLANANKGIWHHRKFSTESHKQRQISGDYY